MALLALVLGIVLLTRGDDEDTTPSGTATAPTLGQEPTASVPGPGPNPKPAIRTIKVVDGEPQGGVQEITVSKDDTVRFKVDSDTAAEVHVHGYDLMKDVETGGTVAFKFSAGIEGVFEIELEETKTPIAELTVEP